MTALRWWCWLWLLPVVVLTARGRAAAQVDLSLSLGSPEVTVGEVVQVRLEAMSEEGDAPSAPDLAVPSGFEVRGPSIGTRQQVSINGFRMVTQQGISVTWRLTPTRPGVYTIGPAAVTWNGQRRRSEAVRLEVLPPGQQPRAPQRRRAIDPFDAFDPFGRNFDDLFDFDRLRGRGSRFQQLPEAPSDLVPKRRLDRLAFVEAHVDTRRAVIGQQVTLSIYAHGSRGLFQEAPGAREPSHPDFLAQRLVEDGSRQPVYQYNLDGERWIAVKVRELALFPLRAGRLEVGPLEFGFLGRRYGTRGGEGLRRSTRPIIIEVTEPPSDGRPPGYTGDVGAFELEASVEPRRVEAGGSVAVTARVSGTGRLPGALLLPEQTGVEWLEPTLRDDVTVQDSKVGGERRFSYVVRLTRPGEVDLGRLKLPLYDPRTRRYRVAEVDLGRVEVEAAESSAVLEPEASGPRLSELVRFRSQLEPLEPRAYLADSPLLWWWIGLGPSAVVGAAGVAAVSGRLRRSLRSREQALSTHATRALEEARAAHSRGEPGAVASAVERAIYAAVEWATGVKARAVLRAELARELTAAGLPPELAARVEELLEASGQLRLGGSDVARAQQVVDPAESLVAQLVRRPQVRPAAARERRA